jgi:hypothetical protein
MLLSAVSVLVVAQLSSEVPEGLMNYPVFKDSVSTAQSKNSTPSIKTNYLRIDNGIIGNYCEMICQ